MDVSGQLHAPATLPLGKERTCTKLTGLKYVSGLYPDPTESEPHPHTLYVRSILILPSHLLTRIASVLFLVHAPTTMLYTFLRSHACYVPSPRSLISSLQ